MQEFIHPVHHSAYRPKVSPVLMGVLAFLVVASVVFTAGFLSGKLLTTREFSKKIALLGVKGTSQEKTYPLMKYSFSELAKRGGIASEITIDRVLATTPEFTAYVFHFTSEGRKISGQLNVPNAEPQSKRPVILMMRGYVPPADYTIGKGTSPSAAALANAGYITIAPDFLGFGESDMPPGETLAERFVKPLNVLDLIATVEKLDGQSLTFENKTIGTIDAKRLGLWGHSNGGQISLSVLEITGRPIPTVLLAPVSKFFPYSVLYFTDEDEDKGKGLRAVIAKFEADYNIEQFSIGNNVDHINSKIQLHQGGKDVEVPQKWSDDFYSYFAGKGKKDQIEYFLYPNADHLLVPETDTVKQRAIVFFDKEVKNWQPVPTATPTDVPVEQPIISPGPTLPATPVEESATSEAIPIN